MAPLERLDPFGMLELLRLLEQLEIMGSVREEMLDDPERALPILEGAIAAPGIRNPAAFAISRWRRPTSTAEPRPEPRLDYEPGPPALSVIERAWAGEPTPMREAMLEAMAAAIGKAGGFGAIRESFDRTDTFELDDEGNLITTNPAWIREPGDRLIAP